MKKILLFAVPALLASCSPKSSQTVATDSAPQAMPPHAVKLPTQEEGSAAVVLKASAFRMSGDYANNVAVTVGADGRLVYYPAPSDITPGSKPELIGEGWYLNRQGIGPNSVFTKWTFEEYRNLPSVPSQEEIRAAIIPGAEVTEFRQLPIPAAQANVTDPASLLYLLQ